MKYNSRKFIDFLLFDIFRIEDLFNYTYYDQHHRESISMVIDTMESIAREYLAPYIKSADKEVPELKDGQVNVHPGIHRYVKVFKESGLQAATFDPEYEGMNLPKLAYGAILNTGFMANNSFMMFTDVIYGVSNLILSFGTPEQKKEYLPGLLTGDYYGTMCLTEPQAGSSLSDITCAAHPRPDGTYKIKGQKIFISAGDHDIGSNIIHMVLAKIPGSPKGAKGISLFIVPKYKMNTAKVSNDVTSVSVYHKLGQKATPAMHLSFGDRDDCTGYLLGKENQGLIQMFQMMNGERLSVGLLGISIAQSGYNHALQYAFERKQGRKINFDNESDDPVLIGEHPDIRRMLYSQKAVIQGGLALLFQCFYYMDLQIIDPNQEKYALLLELLTPVAKTFGAEYGQASVNQSLQIFGGYGYTEDFPLEQLYRDIRIMSLYEGTTGIHGLAVLGRQIPYKNGISFTYLKEEIISTIHQANTIESLHTFSDILRDKINLIEQTISKLNEDSRKKGKAWYLSHATIFIDALSLVCVGWQWLKIGIGLKAYTDDEDFKISNLDCLRYFYKYELTKFDYLNQILMNYDDVLLNGKLN